MIALLLALGGGIFRMAPEVLKFLNGKADRAHEIEMRKLDLQAAQLQHDNKMAEITTEMAGKIDTASLGIFSDAIKAQAQPSGIRWIDAMSASVRPTITYWFMCLYTAVKVAMLCTVLGDGSSWANAILFVWGEADVGAFFGILNYWFLDRTLAKRGLA